MLEIYLKAMKEKETGKSSKHILQKPKSGREKIYIKKQINNSGFGQSYSPQCSLR